MAESWDAIKVVFFISAWIIFSGDLLYKCHGAIHEILFDMEITSDCVYNDSPLSPLLATSAWQHNADANTMHFAPCLSTVEPDIRNFYLETARASYKL